MAYFKQTNTLGTMDFFLFLQRNIQRQAESEVVQSSSLVEVKVEVEVVVEVEVEVGVEVGVGVEDESYC